MLERAASWHTTNNIFEGQQRVVKSGSFYQHMYEILTKFRPGVAYGQEDVELF